MSKFKMSHLTAEIILSSNIDKHIRAEVLNQNDRGRECLIFDGLLKYISCNTIVIENNKGLIEMFRWEDTINLRCE